jgi:hypothetical protein
MKYGPFQAEELILPDGKALEPGYYFSSRGVVLVAGYRGAQLLLPFEGKKPCIDDQTLRQGTLMKLPVERVDVSFDAPVAYDTEPLWGSGYLVITGSGRACLATIARPETQGEHERVLIDLKTCRVVVPDTYPERWMWLPKWEILHVRPDGSPWTFAESPPPPPVTALRFGFT